MAAKSVLDILTQGTVPLPGKRKFSPHYDLKCHQYTF